jgi:large subunit ribosomal protein L7/L12
MGTLDLPSFVLGAVAALALVVLIRVLRRDMDAVRTSGNAIGPTTRSMPALRRSEPGNTLSMGPPSQLVTDLMRQGRKIEAIKLYRQQTGTSLVDAKNAVEALESRYGSARTSQTGRR